MVQCLSVIFKKRKEKNSSTILLCPGNEGENFKYGEVFVFVLFWVQFDSRFPPKSVTTA